MCIMPFMALQLFTVITKKVISMVHCLDFTQFLLTVYKVSICDDATLISSNCQKKVITKHLPGLSI